jgi:hypothetical protein
MSTMLDLAESYFTRCTWRHSRVAGRQDLIELVFENPRARWKSYAKASGDDRTFLFYSICAVNVPEERRPAVAEFITRVNFGLVSGNFEMDWADGEVRFKTGIELTGIPPTTELVTALVQPNLTAVIRYLPGLLKVISNEADPETARADCEESGV